MSNSFLTIWHYFFLPSQLANTWPPAIYAMCGKRDGETYVKIWMAVKRLLGEETFNTAIMDFEIQSHQACNVVFPDVETNGCHFHLAQVNFMHGLKKLK